MMVWSLAYHDTWSGRLFPWHHHRQPVYRNAHLLEMHSCRCLRHYQTILAPMPPKYRDSESYSHFINEHRIELFAANNPAHSFDPRGYFIASRDALVDDAG